MSDPITCNNCKSTNVYVTEKEIVCRKCGARRKRYHTQAAKQEITKLKMEKS